MSGGVLGRRGMLLAGVGVLAGCSGSSSGAADGRGTSVPTPTVSGASRSSPAAGSPSPNSPGSPGSAAPTVALPSVRSWAPGPGEIEPAAKRVAVAAAVQLLRPRGTRGVVEVIDAQYGGILTDTASVLVPCRVYTIVSGRVVTGGATVDVRLTKNQGSWRVTATHPSRPGPAAPRLSAAARQVLANERILLPPASAADIRSGQVHDTVLRAMLELATTYQIGVSVIRSGHPRNVFGTNRRSDHPQGRAFDTWQINGRAVVAPSTPRSLITSYLRASAAAGSYNVGGPYQLAGATYFSDRTHQDHTHAGFRP
ncbi:hypothetical protein [Kribbella sp. NPDC048915]|uniref:hypothetical protein n=1 Tax=Kribbella sp. NPDC048915 TaxID=3155148 RepID=UPI003411D4A9